MKSSLFMDQASRMVLKTILNVSISRLQTVETWLLRASRAQNCTRLTILGSCSTCTRLPYHIRSLDLPWYQVFLQQFSKESQAPQQPLAPQFQAKNPHPPPHLPPPQKLQQQRQVIRTLQPLLLPQAARRQHSRLQPRAGRQLQALLNNLLSRPATLCADPYTDKQNTLSVVERIMLVLQSVPGVLHVRSSMNITGSVYSIIIGIIFRMSSQLVGL